MENFKIKNQDIINEKIKILYLLYIGMFSCFLLSGMGLTEYLIFNDLKCLIISSIFGLIGGVTFDYIMLFNKICPDKKSSLDYIYKNCEKVK